MRDQIPVRFADGTQEDFPASTEVTLPDGARAPSRGLGQRKSRDGLVKLRQLGREQHGGAAVTLPDGREGTILGWGDEIADLRAELEQLRPLRAAQVAADMVRGD